MKASSWPLAASCSSPKKNISALITASAKAMKRHNNNNNNDNNKNNVKNRNNIRNIEIIEIFVLQMSARRVCI